MGLIFHKNIFSTKTDSTVGTFIESNYVNFTNNIFEVQTVSKFGFHGYLKLEKKLDDVSDVFDLEGADTYEETTIKNNILVTYYRNSGLAID